MDEMLQAWATPIIKREWPDAARFNQQLLAALHAWRQQEPGTVSSNVGGWRSSDRNLLRRHEPGFAELSAWLQNVVRETNRAIAPTAFGIDQTRIFLNGWANISKAGDHNMCHIHPESMWSGVYYLVCTSPVPERPMAGCLELRDPRAGCSMVPAFGSPFGRVLHINPKPGMLVLFPSWLPHGVLPVAGEGERVSIAFNSYIAAKA